MAIIRRCWINQPSTFQPYHKWHGMNVLVAFDHDGYDAVVYFLEGDTISITVNRGGRCAGNIFSRGWRK